MQKRAYICWLVDVVPVWLLRVVLCVSLQAAEQGRPPEHTSKFYAKGALQYLVPILTQTLTKQVSCKMPAVYPEVVGGETQQNKSTAVFSSTLCDSSAAPAHNSSHQHVCIYDFWRGLYPSLYSS